MTVLQALNRYYDRMAARGEAEELGFTRENISYALSISANGVVRDVFDLRVNSGRRIVPVRMSVPRPKRTSDIQANFLWDKTAYVFGVDNGKSKRLDKEHIEFKTFHHDMFIGIDDIHAKALLAFLEKWTPGQFTNAPFKPEMLGTSFIFRLEDEQQYFHEVPILRNRWITSLAETTTPQTMCLVTGEIGPLETGHPIIKGVDNAQPSGAYLVSFNAPAYTSYGKPTDASNAPVSRDTAARYGAALNGLLTRGNRNRIARPVGDASVVFWADTSNVVGKSEEDKEAKARAAEDFFAQAIEPSAEADDEDADAKQAVKVRDALDKLAKGRPVRDLDLGLAEGTRFHVLGLAPNAARLSVRYWLDDDFDVFAQRLAEHYSDLAIEPAPWRATLPSVQRLLVKTTALQEKFDNIPPLLAGEMMRAVLGGGRYPSTLLSAVMIRLRAGDPKTRDGKSGNIGWHVAAIRAVLFRDQRLRRHNPDVPEPGETPMSLKKDHPNKGYQLGRLFAVYELAQRSALAKVNATIRDKYFGAASATPASVFPIIVRGAQNHLSKVRKEKPGWAHLIEKELEEIYSRIEPVEPLSLPRALHLSDQGEFAVGYYHQRAAKLRSEKGEQIGFDNVTADAEDQEDNE